MEDTKWCFVRMARTGHMEQAEPDFAGDFHIDTVGLSS